MLVLNKLNSQYPPAMPAFQISWLGIAAGTILGVLVVMIASNSPAKLAAKVSPQAAITGNINQTNNQAVNKASNTKLLHVDTAMGVRHAFSNMLHWLPMMNLNLHGRKIRLFPAALTTCKMAAAYWLITDIHRNLTGRLEI